VMIPGFDDTCIHSFVMSSDSDKALVLALYSQVVPVPPKSKH